LGGVKASKKQTVDKPTLAAMLAFEVVVGTHGAHKF
jgi:hypothetical protein